MQKHEETDRIAASSKPYSVWVCPLLPVYSHTNIFSFITVSVPQNPQSDKLVLTDEIMSYVTLKTEHVCPQRTDARMINVPSVQIRTLILHCIVTVPRVNSPFKWTLGWGGSYGSQTGGLGSSAKYSASDLERAENKDQGCCSLDGMG